MQCAFDCRTIDQWAAQACSRHAKQPPQLQLPWLREVALPSERSGTTTKVKLRCSASRLCTDFASGRKHAVRGHRRRSQCAEPAQQGPAQHPQIFPAASRCCWKCWKGGPPFAKPAGACSCPAAGARSASRLGIQTTVVPSGPALATAMRRGNQRSALTGATWPVHAATSATSARLTGAPALVLTRHTRIARSSQPAPSGEAWAHVCGPGLFQLVARRQLTRRTWRELRTCCL